MEELNKVRQRSEIPAEDTWAIEDLYATDDAWRQELTTLEEDKKKLASFAGRLGESGQTLYEYLYTGEQVNVKASRLANYCMRKSDEDTRNSVYQAMTGEFVAAAVALDAQTSFETPEIMEIPEDDLNRFYAQYPALERYRRYLTDLRRKKAHVLSAAEEKLLAAAGEMAQAPDKVYGMLADADLKFQDAVDSQGNKLPLRQGTFISYQESADRGLRKSA